MEQITLSVLTHCAITALMETFFSKGYEKISEQLYSDREHLANGHLLKAVRIAMLESTKKVRDEAVTNTILKFGRESEEGRQAEKFEFAITSWLEEELQIAKSQKEEIIFKTTAYDSIESLLIEAKNFSQKELLKNLSDKVKLEYWAELEEVESLHNIFPAFFINYFKNTTGGIKNKEETDWFDNTCIIFGNIISDPKYSIAKDKFNNRLLSEIKTELKIKGYSIEEIKEGLIQIIKQKENKEQALINQLNEIQRLLAGEKSEKDKQREYFLKKEDEQKYEIEQLKIQYEHLVFKIAQAFNPQDNILKSEIEEQIRETESAQSKLLELKFINESEIKSIEEKYLTQINRLVKQIEELNIELNLQKDSQNLLNKLSHEAASEIEKLVANNDFDLVISYPVNNPSYTLKDSAFIFLIKANVLANQFRIQEAEDYYIRSVSVFEYDKNLLAYSKFLFIKKDWGKCLEISKQALNKNINPDEKLILVNQVLDILLTENKNEEAILLSIDFIEKNDLSQTNQYSQAYFFLTQGKHYMNNYDLSDARECYKRVIELTGIIDDEKFLQLHFDAELFLGDTFFDYRLIITFDKDEDIKKAIIHYENAKGIVEKVEDQSSSFFKLASLRILHRIGVIEKGKGDNKAFEKFTLSGGYGQQIYNETNGLQLEDVSNVFQLHIHYLNENITEANYSYFILASMKNIIQTKTDLLSQQNLFYINTWFFLLNFVNSKSTLSDYHIKVVISCFEKCASKSCNEFIQNGIMFLRVASGYYQNFEVEAAIPIYDKLICWLEILDKRKPIAFKKQLCDTYINVANTFNKIGNTQEALKSFSNAQNISEEIISDQHIKFSLQSQIKLGIIAVEMNEGKKDEVTLKLDELYKNIESHVFNESYNELDEKCELLFTIANQYLFCNCQYKAFEIFRSVLVLIKSLLDNFEKYSLNVAQMTKLLYRFSETLLHTGKIHIENENLNQGASDLLQALSIKKKYLQEYPQSAYLVIPDYCKIALEVSQVFMQKRILKEAKEILSDVLKLCEPYRNQAGHEWAEKTIHDASIMLSVYITHFANKDELIEFDNISDSFNHEQLLTGFSSLLVSTGLYLKDKNYAKAVEILTKGINNFNTFLTEKGKLIDYEYFFQMTFNLYKAYLGLKKYAEAEDCIETGYFFSKKILATNSKDEKQFVMVCEHYQFVLGEVLAASSIFSKAKVRNRIKQIYQDMKTTVDKHPIKDDKEAEFFSDMMNKLFKLI